MYCIYRALTCYPVIYQPFNTVNASPILRVFLSNRAFGDGNDAGDDNAGHGELPDGTLVAGAGFLASGFSFPCGGRTPESDPPFEAPHAGTERGKE